MEKQINTPNSRITITQIMKNLFFIMIGSSFFGSYLAIPTFRSLFLFRISFYLLIVFFTLYFMKNGKIRLDKSYKNYLIFFMFWIFYSIFSIAWSVNMHANIKYNYFLIENIIIISMCVYFLKNSKDIDKLFRIIFYIFMINVFVAIVEIYTGWHLKEIDLYYLNTWVINAPYTFFHNINDTAGFFALYLPLTYIPLSKSKNGKFIFAIVFIVTSFIVFSTYSRINYIVIILQFFYFFGWLSKREKNKFVIVLNYFLLIVLISVIFLYSRIQSGFMFGPNTSIIDALTSLTGVVSDDSGSLFIRRNLVLETGKIFLNSGLMGVGAGNIETKIEAMNLIHLGGTTNLHNWWIELLGNYGIFVFVGFTFMYVGTLRKLRKLRIKTDDAEMTLKLQVAYISLMSFALVSLSSSSIIQIRYIWIVFGISLALISVEKNKYKKVKL